MVRDTKYSVRHGALKGLRQDLKNKGFKWYERLLI